MRRLLDICCGAGGAAKGYELAGFDEIWGIDIAPQPRYPYNFIQEDALYALGYLRRGNVLGGLHLSDFDAIHVSPPCQRWSKALNCRPGLRETYPDLITPIRERLKLTGLPYVIENVLGAPLIDPLSLCGCMFGMTTEFRGRRVGLRRKRLFETSFPVPRPGPCKHDYKAVPIFGHSAGGNEPLFRGKGFAALSREVMGIDWMRREELMESIPPKFTQYVGMFLLNAAEVREMAGV